MTTTTAAGPQADVPTFRRLMQQPDVVLLDVRSPGEFASFHVDGFCNLPLDLLRGRAAEVVRRADGPIAVVCAQGLRAEQAARLLADAGAPQVRVLAGGLDAWAAAGGEVIRGEGRWAMDRQVRLVAGSLVLTGVLASLVKPRAKWLAGAVGCGLTFSALTDTCAMGRALACLPYNRSGPTFDLEAALDSLGRGPGPI